MIGNTLAHDRARPSVTMALRHSNLPIDWTDSLGVLVDDRLLVGFDPPQSHQILKRPQLGRPRLQNFKQRHYAKSDTGEADFRRPQSANLGHRLPCR